MQIQVNVNNLKLIQSDELNENEYNIHNIQFNFSNEYAEELAKVALFTANDTTYKVIITNNQCNIPVEVLANQGCFTLGVYAFEVQGEELIERYSPSPIKLYIEDGSYIPDEDTENSEPLTPTDKEQILAILAQLEIDAQQIEINTQNIADIQEEQKTQNTNIQNNTDNIERIEGLIPTKTSELINDSNFVNETQLNTAIGIEETARQNADNNLQSQIDAITVSSDVIDVLGTYQELQNYDTSHVKANDIIKVLQDSTHNDAISYYRWIITDHVGAWVYVGSEGPYYTKSETDTLLQGKANQSDLNTTNNNLSNLTNRVSTAEGKITDIENEQLTQNSKIATLENEVDTLQQQVEDLENNQLTGTATGTSIYIDDSASAKNRSIGLMGNTTQDGTPTPENPIPINNTGDEGYINEKVQNKNLQSGNQLYQKMLAFDASGLREESVDGKMSIKFSNGLYRKDRGFNCLDYNYKENTSYTIRGLFKLSSTTYDTLYMRVYYKGGTYNSVNTTSSTNWQELRIVSSANKIIDSIVFTYGNSGAYWYLDESSWFIGEGDITDYVAHEEQNISFPLAQGQKFYKGDYLADDGIHHVMGEIILDGSENWLYNASSESNNVSAFALQMANIKSVENTDTDIRVFCDKFKRESANVALQIRTQNIIALISNKRIYLCVPYSDFGTNVSNIKTWLSNNNIKVQYPLKTEVIDAYTEEQETAWEQIKALRTYKPVTHISSSNATPATVDIEYIRDLETVINSLSN